MCHNDKKNRHTHTKSWMTIVAVKKRENLGPFVKNKRKKRLWIASKDRHVREAAATHVRSSSSSVCCPFLGERASHPWPWSCCISVSSSLCFLFSAFWVAATSSFFFIIPLHTRYDSFSTFGCRVVKQVEGSTSLFFLNLLRLVSVAACRRILLFIYLFLIFFGQGLVWLRLTALCGLI